MEGEQDDMPFVCAVADCGMRFINEDHLNWHSKKHEMSLALNTGGQANSSPAHHNFLDQTPTPTKFLKNCEEIGLFQELTPNPFDNAYKKALDDPTAPLPGPQSAGGELNTPTLILTDGHNNNSSNSKNSSSTSAAAPSPLSLERMTTQSSAAPTVSSLRLSEPLKPSPLAADPSKPASTAVTCATSVAVEASPSLMKVSGVDTATTALALATDSASAKLKNAAAAGQNKVMLDLSGRSVMTGGHQQMLAVAPTTKVATVQPLVMQNTSTSQKEKLVTEVATLQTSRFLNTSAVSGSGRVMATVNPEVKVKAEPKAEREEAEEAGGNTQQQQQQQQCTMQVLLQLPTGETVPISIPATINKLQYLGANQLQQQLQQQQQQPSPQQQQHQQQQQSQSTLAKLSPAPSPTPANTSQTTAIKQRLKAQLQSQLSPTAKAGVLGDLPDLKASAGLPSAFTVATTTSAPVSHMVDSTSPIMMLDSPGSEMNLSDSSDYSIDSKRQKMSPESGDPDERRRKFLERNRAAAARCRQKRKHWISNLEKKADELQSTNSKLQNEVKLLKGEVAQLKTLLIAHKDCPVTQQQKSQGQLQHVLLPDPQAQVVPTVEPVDAASGSLHMGQLITILQPEASHRDPLQGT